MMNLQIIEFLTIIVSVCTILLILMNQPNQTDTFGAKATFAQTRRGFEKKIYHLAIGSSALLFLLLFSIQILK